MNQIVCNVCKQIIEKGDGVNFTVRMPKKEGGFERILKLSTCVLDSSGGTVYQFHICWPCFKQTIVEAN